MNAEHKNRHITLYIFLGLVSALLLALLVFFLIDYSHYAKDKSPYRTLFVPRLEVGAFRITNLTADRTDLTAAMLIHNPLPFNLRADSLQYQIYINGTQVIESSYGHSIDILKWDSTWINLPVTAYTDKLVTVLTSAENRGEDSADYEIVSHMGTNLVVHKHFDFDIKTRQPLIFIPKVKLNEVLYDSLNLQGVLMYFDVTVVNKNVFPLNFKDLDFRVAIADNDWVEGHKYGVTEIPDSSVVKLKLPLYISFKQIGKSLGPLIKHGKNTPFKFELTLKLVSDNKAIKNSVIVLKDAASIHEIVKLAKEENAKTKQKEAREKEADPEGFKEKKKEEKEKKKENKVKIHKVHHPQVSNRRLGKGTLYADDKPKGYYKLNAKVWST